jgi:hypothetical protein
MLTNKINKQLSLYCFSSPTDFLDEEELGGIEEHMQEFEHEDDEEDDVMYKPKR